MSSNKITNCFLLASYMDGRSSRHFATSARLRQRTTHAKWRLPFPRRYYTDQNILWQQQSKGIAYASTHANINHVKLRSLWLILQIPLNPARLKSRQRLAVLVYITGSTFNDGGNYWIDPSPLASTGNVIIVKVQFRLGPFGWLSTLSDKFRGNLAIQDIQMALKWVQDNIQAFGGDNQRVTLIGSGGGATIAHLLMLKVSQS